MPSPNMAVRMNFWYDLSFGPAAQPREQQFKLVQVQVILVNHNHSAHLKGVIRPFKTASV